ncbi:LLM class flavin-dependent oxidoreductase [Methylovirgula sp. 4M-Z18]|uniref:LLM class flavin-dependent oxidoreductase n=1 Tax=Methylovirgula sp. 4M-Z18 TaxID=2293567 RepID=UPI000E2F65D6|nr:LLM class flavin-dependent oxidoreductase [Methylovirgula sp. 4M-Z18]RFB74999.1 LLM class flavin-dependent oxidoreductase [Methylovirgula sp. 4M-Z18]
MQIGIDSFVASIWNDATKAWGDGADRVRDLLDEIVLADEVGIDVFGIGEHHREEYVASSPATLLAAAAARTRNIRLTSAVSVLSSDDPIRLFQQFATIDLISRGRAEMIVGRGSFIESYPLFGYDLNHYDLLFSEKLDLLLKVRADTHVHWSGRHRAPLTGQAVYPRPVQNPLPIFIGVGGTPDSFIRAGRLGLPLIVAIIGGEPHRFRPLVDLYRQSGLAAGHPPEQLTVGVHALGFLAVSDDAAADLMWPSYEKAVAKIGKERGWGPVSRAQFDATRGRTGALLVGSPETIADKMLYMSEALGGLSGVTIRLDGGLLSHRDMMRAIELLGTQVAPRVRKQSAA